MKIGFLITARLKSSRLKIKLLQPLNGYSVMERVIQRAKQVTECQDVVLCTSRTNQDLPLMRLAQKHNIFYYNGDGEDVLLRLKEAAELFDFDTVIGITADNPLFSIYHANLLSDHARRNPHLDFIYTTGLPIGVNMYAIKVKALKTVCAIKKEVDTEIWGPLINRKDIFNVEELPVDEGYRFDISRLTCDEFADYELFREIYKCFPQDHVIDILEAYEVLRNRPELKKINAHVTQRELDPLIKDRIDRFFSDNLAMILDIKKQIYRDGV